MSTKLTLTIDQHVIEKAKLYAKSQKRSLSNLIESYLRSVIMDQKTESETQDGLSPIVSSLKGAVKYSGEVIDTKKILEEELLKKYLG